MIMSDFGGGYIWEELSDFFKIVIALRRFQNLDVPEAKDKARLVLAVLDLTECGYDLKDMTMTDVYYLLP
jgi:hypothetical protein